MTITDLNKVEKKVKDYLYNNSFSVEKMPSGIKATISKYSNHVFFVASLTGEIKEINLPYLDGQFLTPNLFNNVYPYLIHAHGNSIDELNIDVYQK